MSGIELRSLEQMDNDSHWTVNFVHLIDSCRVYKSSCSSYLFCFSSNHDDCYFCIWIRQKNDVSILPEFSCKNRIILTRKTRRSSFIGVPLYKDCDSNQNKTTCRKKNERWLNASSVFCCTIIRTTTTQSLFLFHASKKKNERECDDRHRYERNRKRMNKNKVVHKLLVYDGADKQLSGQRLNDCIHTKTSFFFNILLVTFVIYLLPFFITCLRVSHTFSL
jgi:hypothetical protein